MHILLEFSEDSSHLSDQAQLQWYKAPSSAQAQLGSDKTLRKKLGA